MVMHLGFRNKLLNLRVGCDCRKGTSDECAERRPRRTELQRRIDLIHLTRSPVRDEGTLNRPRAALKRRGPGRPGHGRREPNQMASRAHHLLFWSLHPETLSSQLPGCRRALRILLQLLLRERSPAAAPSQTRPAYASLRR